MERPIRSTPVSRKFAMAAGFAAILLGLSAGAYAGKLAQVRFEISPQAIDIRGDLYGRSIPRSQLVLDQARVVDLNVEPRFRKFLKLNGIGLPHYKSGWFLLKNSDRALVFMTRFDQAVVVPTTAGYTLMITPDQPAELLAALQQPDGEMHVFPISPRR
jgi:hypothetical protein